MEFLVEFSPLTFSMCDCKHTLVLALEICRYSKTINKNVKKNTKGGSEWECEKERDNLCKVTKHVLFGFRYCSYNCEANKRIQLVGFKWVFVFRCWPEEKSISKEKTYPLSTHSVYLHLPNETEVLFTYLPRIQWHIRYQKRVYRFKCLDSVFNYRWIHINPTDMQILASNKLTFYPNWRITM